MVCCMGDGCIESERLKVKCKKNLILSCWEAWCWWWCRYGWWWWCCRQSIERTKFKSTPSSIADSRRYRCRRRNHSWSIGNRQKRREKKHAHNFRSSFFFFALACKCHGNVKMFVYFIYALNIWMKNIMNVKCISVYMSNHTVYITIDNTANTGVYTHTHTAQHKTESNRIERAAAYSDALLLMLLCSARTHTHVHI